MDEKQEKKKEKEEKEELKKLSRVGSPEWAYIIKLQPFIFFFFSLLFEDRQATGGFCHLGFFYPLIFLSFFITIRSVALRT